MIEVVALENGEKVIRFQGKLLASRFNPVQEAKDWLASRRSLIEQVKSVFVLGLGSGFHVRELLANTKASIVVLETEPEIIDQVTQMYSFDSSRVKIVHLQSARALRSEEAVKKAVAQSFVVLTHPPSMAVQPTLYGECHEQLLGRDWGNLNWQWKIRNAPEFDRVARIDGGTEALTIHDLEQTELVQNSEEREKLLFKALRELVK